MQSQKNCTQLEPSRLSALKLSPRKFAIDDYIGMESCVDMKDSDNHDDEAEKPPANVSICPNIKRDGRMWGMKRKDFPPPIPLLAQTENLASHMPWVLKRHYTADGRLILTEEKVRHHEYFRAHRSNGRLMLQLVALDDDHVAAAHHLSYRNVEVGSDETETSGGHGQDLEDSNDRDVDDLGNGDQNDCPKTVGGGGGEAGKCLAYGNGSGTDSAFMFGVAVRGSLKTIQS